MPLHHRIQASDQLQSCVLKARKALQNHQPQSPQIIVRELVYLDGKVSQKMSKNHNQTTGEKKTLE
jgi:hypothetical protein